MNGVQAPVSPPVAAEPPPPDPLAVELVQEWQSIMLAQQHFIGAMNKITEAWQRALSDLSLANGKIAELERQLKDAVGAAREGIDPPGNGARPSGKVGQDGDQGDVGAGVPEKHEALDEPRGEEGAQLRPGPPRRNQQPSPGRDA